MTERRKTEERVRRALARTELPDEYGAEQRGREVVTAAFADGSPRPTGRRRFLRGGAALLAAVLLGGAALTPAGADVREWLADRVSPDENVSLRQQLTLPSPGSVLVEAPGGVWVVHEDGARRRLGDYERATWSSNGLYVGVASGNTLTAIEPDGDERWSLDTPGRISELDWSTDEGDRIAYVDNRTNLRVAVADGSADTLLATHVRPIAPAWRPDLSAAAVERELAYALGDGSVRVVNSDTGELVFSISRSDNLNGIEWAPDGKSLVTVGPDAIERYGLSGGIERWRAGSESRSPTRWTAAAVSPVRGQIAAISRQEGQSTLNLLGPGNHSGLVSVPSRTDDLSWSPDGKWILLGLRDVDQWLFVRVRDGSVEQVSNVSRLFDPGSTHGGRFPRVAGWCCAGESK